MTRELIARDMVGVRQIFGATLTFTLALTFTGVPLPEFVAVLLRCKSARRARDTLSISSAFNLKCPLCDEQSAVGLLVAV